MARGERTRDCPEVSCEGTQAQHRCIRVGRQAQRLFVWLRVCSLIPQAAYPGPKSLSRPERTSWDEFSACVMVSCVVVRIGYIASQEAGTYSDKRIESHQPNPSC